MLVVHPDLLAQPEELEESGLTLEANALQKARFIHRLYHVDCFAEDTGLEVMALNNEPGIFSARYAGKERDAEDNMNLLLTNMKGISDRRARFRTIIVLIVGQKEFSFEGVTFGTIGRQKIGSGGFGYDPVFMPNESDKTFGEMSPREKNNYSHRKKAFFKMIHFLEQQNILTN